MTSPLSTVVFGPSSLLPVAQAALEQLGVACQTHDPANGLRTWEQPFEAAIVLLTPDVEDLLEPFEELLYHPGTEALFDESEGRETWNADQWAHHWQAKIRALQAKGAQRQASLSVLMEPVETTLAAPITEPLLSLDEEWGNMVFPNQTAPEAVLEAAPQEEGSPTPAAPIVAQAEPGPAMEVATATASVADWAMGEFSLADKDTAWEAPVASTRAPITLDTAGLYFEGEEPESASPEDLEEEEAGSIGSSTALGLVAVMAGAGGPAVLRDLLAHLSPASPSPWVIYQPLPQGRHGVLATTLARGSRAQVTSPPIGQALEAGQAYVLDEHQSVERTASGGLIVVAGGPESLIGQTAHEGSVLMLLSGASLHWMLSVLEAATAGALVLVQTPDTAYDKALLTALESAGLVTGDMPTLAAHVSEYHGLTAAEMG